MGPEIQPNYPTTPIAPANILEVRAETLPEEVYIAVNGLIAEKLHGQIARFTIKALTKRMVELGLDENEIKQRNWTRIGSVYKEMGWKVQYIYPSEDDRDFDSYYYFDSSGPRSW